ncbi:hypothetical protein ACROYT_G010156 [Oculina patagonica]
MTTSFSNDVDSQITGEAIILYILTVTGIVANAFAILASAKLLKMQPLSPNVFVLGLSCVDLISLTFFSIPSWLFYINGEWLGGKQLCDYQGFVFLFSTLCSAFLATSMAVDRCIAVTKPFFHRKTMTVNKAKVLILAAIAASFVISFFPILSFGSFVQNLSGSFCTVNWFPQTSSDSAFCVFYAILGGLPAIVVLFCNITVIWELFRSKQRRVSVTNMILPGARQMAQARNSEREDTETQFSRTMVLISVVYLFGWIPFMVRLIGNAFYNWRNSSADLLVCCFLLLNFIADPFMYVLTRKQYREVLKMIFSCRCKGRLDDRVFPLGNQSQHPSISSASLQAFCFSGNEQQLNDLREILQSTSPYPQRTEERNRRRDIIGVLQTI